MKKSILVLFGTLLASTSAIAMMAPQYYRLRLIDAAIEEVATNHLKIEDADETPITAISVQGEVILVSVKNEVCPVLVKAKAVPGLAGAPQLTTRIIDSCGTLNLDPKTVRAVSYEKISEKLDRAAKLGKLVTGLEVNQKTGKVKIITGK